MKTDNRYCIGNDDCRISFEMECKNGRDVTIRSFIRCHHGEALDKGDEFASRTVMVPDALQVAKRQIQMAWKWLDDNGIKLTKRDRRESEKAAERFIQKVDSWFIIDRDPPG